MLYLFIIFVIVLSFYILRFEIYKYLLDNYTECVNTLVFVVFNILQFLALLIIELYDLSSQFDFLKHAFLYTGGEAAEEFNSGCTDSQQEDFNLIPTVVPLPENDYQQELGNFNPTTLGPAPSYTGEASQSLQGGEPIVGINFSDSSSNSSYPPAAQDGSSTPSNSNPTRSYANPSTADGWGAAPLLRGTAHPEGG